MEDDDGETETPNPAPEQSPDSPQTPPTDPPASQEPFFAAATEDEYKAKIGPDLTQARVGLAKKYGYDTLEAFDAAMKAYKAQEQANMTELERVTKERDTLKTQASQGQERLNAIAVRGELEAQAKALGLNPERLDAIDELRPKNEGEVDAEGNANADLIKTSLESVANRFPEFKAPPTTVGSTATPAAAAAQTTTIDEQIAEAQKKGDFGAMIELQMMKLQAPS